MFRFLALGTHSFEGYILAGFGMAILAPTHSAFGIFLIRKYLLWQNRSPVFRRKTNIRLLVSMKRNIFQIPAEQFRLSYK